MGLKRVPEKRGTDDGLDPVLVKNPGETVADMMDLGQMRESRLCDNRHPMQKSVALFHRAFGMPDLIGSPQPLPQDRIELRVGLIREEGVVELGQAIEHARSGRAGAEVEIIDALVNTLYVSLGGLVEMGQDVLYLHALDAEPPGSGSPLVDTAASAADRIASLLGDLERELSFGSVKGGTIFSWIAWVVDHVIWESGLPIGPFFDEVQRANMSKLGTDGRPVHSRGMEIDGDPEGKVLKGSGYSPPDLHAVYRRVHQNELTRGPAMPNRTSSPSGSTAHRLQPATSRMPPFCGTC